MVDEGTKELREMLMRMTVREILDQDPEAAAIFEDYGIYQIEVTCT